MGRLSRVKPIYAIVAGAGLLLLFGALLLLRASPVAKPTAPSAAQPVVTPLPQPPAPSVAMPEPSGASPGGGGPEPSRARRGKLPDAVPDKKPNPFTPSPRHKAKPKLFQEL